MNGHELLMISFFGIRAEVTSTESDQVFYICMDRFQIDNNYEMDPLFPVLLRPMCTSGGTLVHDHFRMENVATLVEIYFHRKLNMPNVDFFPTIEFLIKELEVKVEFDIIFNGVLG